MKKWFISSAVFHVVILLALWIGMPQFRKEVPLPPPIIPVEIADIGEMTVTKVDDKKEPPPPAPAKPAEPKPEPPKPEPPKPPEPTPEPPKPEPPTPPEPKPPEPKPEPKPPEPPKPEEKPEPMPTPKPKPPEPAKPEPPKVDSLSSVLKNVAKIKKNLPKDEPKPKAEPPKPAATPQPAADPQPAPTPPQAAAMGAKLSISEEDALRRQIASCWNVPVGGRGVENIAVEIYIEVNPDRTVKQAAIVDQARMASDPFFRAVAESGLRALRNPRCSPLALPAEKYQQWKEMIFNFNPRDMF
jgi:hypothetical protein